MWLFAITLCFVSTARSQEDPDSLQTTLDGIQEQFSDDLKGSDLYRAALDGVVRHLGGIMGTQGNRVLTIEQQEARNAWLAGERTGIGAQFSIVVGRGLGITEIIDQGPASKAGLEVGDLIVSMDNHPLTGLNRAAIHQRIEQIQGENVVLDVLRAEDQVHRVTIQRGKYSLSPVQVESNQKIPIAHVAYFGTGTAEALAVFLEEHVDHSAVVIDLRDNAHGRLEEVVDSVDLFLEVGSVILFRGRTNTKPVPVEAEVSPVWTSNAVVLVNRGTSGAAEAFAASLQDHQRAVVIGTRTGGNAMHTSHYPAGRGLVLEIADIQLRSPSGDSWGKRGLTPDVMVESPTLSMPTLGVPIPPDLQRDAAIRLISTSGGR